MDIKEIKKLIKLMTEKDLSELDIVEGDNRIHLKRGSEGVPMITTVPQAAPAAAAEKAPAAEEPPEEFIEIKSPMVGTFYTATSPDSDPYVQVGQAVGQNDVVCVVEAMKVMNEIKADCAGTITEICVKNAQPVEFGQVLFRVKPA